MRSASVLALSDAAFPRLTTLAGQAKRNRHFAVYARRRRLFRARWQSDLVLGVLLALPRGRPALLLRRRRAFLHRDRVYTDVAPDRLPDREWVLVIQTLVYTRADLLALAGALDGRRSGPPESDHRGQLSPTVNSLLTPGPDGSHFARQVQADCDDEDKIPQKTALVSGAFRPKGSRKH